jgi:hypothetical protein
MELDLHEQAANLRELKLARDEAKAQAKSLDEQFKAEQTKLMDRMEDAGVDGIKKDGINFVPVTTIYGQVQDRSEFIKWAEEENPELLERKERSELINELARQCLDDGEEFPPGLGFRTRPYISQRSA